MRRWFAMGLLIGLTHVAAGAAGRGDADVHVSIDARGGIAVHVLVNGAGPFTFILDTGAARSILADDLARQVGAPAVARSEVVTGAGSDVRLVVRLESVAVGSARVEDLLAPLVPASRLSPLGPDVRGLLGQDFLSAFNYTLDYRHGRLTWDGPLTCRAPEAVPMVPAEGRFIMTLQGADGTPLRFVPDSGAEVAVLFHAPVRTELGGDERAERPRAGRGTREGRQNEPSAGGNGGTARRRRRRRGA